jgi:hypothetical protein
MARPAPPEIALESIEFRSDHRLLRGCKEDADWRYEVEACPVPEWTPEIHVPVSHTMATHVRLELAVRAEGDRATLEIRGAGPEGITFVRAPLTPGSGRLSLVSRRRLPRKIRKLVLDVRWSAADGGAVAPERTSNIVYMTAARPRDDKRWFHPEDGVTLKRMDRAVSWVAPLDTLDPHAIVRALMSKFPFYILHPSPKVPREFRHPTYFNEIGGAWAMSDYVAESGECQAIVRLVRGILRQLGIPGETGIVVVWADPKVNGGKTALSADWEKNPAAGLDTTMEVDGKRWIAALVDSEVEEGTTYPPSNTSLEGGKTSPGLNRYEASLAFTHGRTTRYYVNGGAMFRKKDPIVGVFWGLLWVTLNPDGGFRVEKIVTRY